jgi:hypothetical protein
MPWETDGEIAAVVQVAWREDDGVRCLGSHRQGCQLRSAELLEPWKRPQSTRDTAVVPVSMRCFDPVTVPGGPRNVNDGMS